MMRGVGRALEVFAIGTEGSNLHPHDTHTHCQRANQQVLRVSLSGFRDFRGTAVRTPGWGWAEGKASLSISGPDSLPTAPRAMGPCGFSLCPASCPSKWPEGKWVGRRLEHYQS